MRTTVYEIAEDTYRLSTFVPGLAPGGLTVNQYLIAADEPLLFHCGPRFLHDAVSEAAGRIVPVDGLRWITFGHIEADECGSINHWLAAAPHAEVAHHAGNCAGAVDDLVDRPARPLVDEDVLDIGGHRLRVIATPHVPHGWDAQVLYDETTSTLLCGDLFTHIGPAPALVHDTDIVSPAFLAEDVLAHTALTAATAPVIRHLADPAPRTLALMHGPAFAGDCVAALAALADGYAARFEGSLDAATIEASSAQGGSR